MHKAEEILSTIHQKCEAVKEDGIVKEALRNSAEPPLQFPALVVRMGQDTPIARDQAFNTNDLQVSVDVQVRSSPESLDTITLDVREALHKQIMTNPTLGLGYVLEITSQGQDEPEYNSESDDYIMITRINWMVRYRTPIANPSV